MHAKNADLTPILSASPLFSQSGGKEKLRQNLPTATAAPQSLEPIQTQTPQNFKMVLQQNSRTSGSMPVWNSAPKASEIIDNFKGPSDEKFGAYDALDIINPLQHIPVINLAYQHFVGDEIKPVSAILGGALFGGPLGAMAAAIGVAIGSTIGDDIKTAFFGGGDFHSSHYNDTSIAITNLRSPERYNN